MFLPGGEVALLAADGPDAAARVAVRFPAGERRIACAAFPSMSGCEEDGLDGGSDDDDFRPSPDRASATVIRHAAALSPLSVRTVGVQPLVFILPHQSTLRRGVEPGTLIAVARACPAIDGPIQFLC
jgi:hypothetical protein